MRIDTKAPWRFVSAAALVCTLGALAGCPGTLENKERFLADAGALDDGDAGACGDVPTRILTPTCGTNGCHGATAPQQGLDLVSPGLAARVVGVQAKVCSGILVDPQNPSGSLLYTKLMSPPMCGAQMPLARPPLGDTDKACVLAWIAAQ